MNTFTIQDLRNAKPCYDPLKYLPEDWSGTLLDILAIESCPATDRIWAVTAMLDTRTNRLFAVWCARQALALVGNPDPRSVHAVDVAERFANGEATVTELATAWDAARDAAWAAAGAVATAADAAWYAAYAAWDAARNAAWNAAWNAAGAAAGNAAWDAARDAQIEQLKKMIMGVE